MRRGKVGEKLLFLIMSDPSETLQQREIPSLCRQGTCISFLFSFSLFLIYSHSPGSFSAGLLPSYGFPPGNLLFVFSVLTLDSTCLLLNLHLLTSMFLGASQDLQASSDDFRGEVKKTLYVKTVAWGTFITLKT